MNTSSRIPESIIYMIQRVHNQHVGHVGFDKTRDRMLKMYPTSNDDNQLSAYIRQYIQTCACCQKLSQINTSLRAKVRVNNNDIHPARNARSSKNHFAL